MRRLSLALLVVHAPFIMARTERIEPADERKIAYDMRVVAAFQQTMANQPIDHENLNPDEENIPDYAGSFSKSLEHNHVTSALSANGQTNFGLMVHAISTGSQADFNAIQRAPGALPGGSGQLKNPQACYAFALQGRDSSLMVALQPPTLQSAWAAAEILENYWMAICRDVQLQDYGTGLNTDSDGNGGSLTSQAALVLNNLGTSYKGPRIDGVVTVGTIFRGTGEGDLTGPLFSQFLWQDLYRANNPLAPEKQWQPVAQRREFGVSWDDFIQIEDGKRPKSYLPSDFSGQRYPATLRDMATYVHYDAGTAAIPYTNALTMMLVKGFPFAPNLPYYNGSMPNECAFVTLGIADVTAAVSQVMQEALKCAWMNKWRCYRRLRPEAMAGLVHYAKSTNTNPYGLHSSIFTPQAGIDTLQIVYDRNALQATPAYDPHQLLTPAEAETYLLAQVWPEGSPAHPSYPSGHATIAGACVTVIKAFFNDTVLIKNYITPVKPNPADLTTLIPLDGEGEDEMTVGGELNKLAGNIAHARNWAGVHYRADGDYGIQLGERVAIAYLQDQCRKYNESGFTGFELTKFDGQRIRITESSVINL